MVYASRLHARQRRKSGSVPYVSHLLAVTATVLEHGGTEDEAIAALLHDAVEDQGGRPQLEAIRARFGEEVAATVEATTDAFVVPKPPWRERKERYIAHLATASPSACLVSAADKLHNARCLILEGRARGAEAWTPFKGGRDGTLWYLRSVAAALRGRAPDALVDELERTVAELEGLAVQGSPAQGPTPQGVPARGSPQQGLPVQSSTVQGPTVDDGTSDGSG